MPHASEVNEEGRAAHDPSIFFDKYIKYFAAL